MSHQKFLQLVKLGQYTRPGYQAPGGRFADWLVIAFIAAVMVLIAFAGFALILYLSTHGFDRAVLLIPTWFLLVVWVIAAGMTIAGGVTNDIVGPALLGGLVLIVMLIGALFEQGHEDAARALGKNAYFFKMQALVLGGCIGALGGVFNSLASPSINPDFFSTAQTFFAYGALILGGAATPSTERAPSVLPMPGFAFRLSFLNKCDELERPTVAEFFQRAFGTDLPESAARVTWSVSSTTSKMSVSSRG